MKAEWRAESIGWFRGAELVGAALVLYRQLPKVRRYLAYLPEGPVIDWSDDDLGSWLAPMVAHLKQQGAFAVRMGPPVVTRRWSAEQVKDGIADESVRRLSDVPPLDRTQDGACVIAQLHELGWRQQSAEGGFAAGQPQFNFVSPAGRRGRSAALGGRRPRRDEPALAAQHQEGRQGRRRGRRSATRTDLKAFHDLYVHTAERDHFTPRPLSYFETMYDALAAEDPDRITGLARPPRG